MIIVFMSVLAAVVLLFLSPREEPEAVRAVARRRSPWARRALVTGSCLLMIGAMFVLAGGVPDVMARDTVARLDNAVVSQVGAAVSQHAATLERSDWARAAVVQQSFGAAMLLAFAVVLRNRRR